jgi:spermidine synthase
MPSRAAVAFHWLLLATLLACLLQAGARAQSLNERLIHEGKSPFGPIYVMENLGNGLRTLYFELNGARQSAVKLGDPDHLELPYARYAVAALGFARPQPERMLVVGLGGGSLPMFLRQRYPEAVIDVAEINPGVVEVATKFLGFREDARMHAFAVDGRAFIEKAAAGTYDAIFLDAFGAYEVPRSVRRAVRKDGVVVGNVWGPTHNRIYGPMMRTYESVFDQIYLLEVRGSVNRIAMALPRREFANALILAGRDSRISRERRYPFDMGELVRHSWLEREDYSTHQVLRDQR